MLHRSKSHRSQSTTEYGLLLAIVCGVLILAMPVISLGLGSVNSTFHSVISSAIGDNPTPSPTPTPTPTPAPGGTPTGHVTDVNVGGDTTYVSGSGWPANDTVIVTYTSGEPGGDPAGYPYGYGLGSFSVGTNGSNAAYTPMWVASDLPVGSYGLLFSSTAQPAQTASANLNILPLTSAVPTASASDTGVGGTTYLSAAHFAASVLVTVTFTSGDLSGHSLGTFSVGTNGAATAVPAVVDSQLGRGSYNLLFSAGSQTAVTTLNISDPQGYATDIGVGGTTYLYATYFSPGSTVTVTYDDGPGSLDQGVTLGLPFTVGDDGSNPAGSPASVDPNLVVGIHNLLFTSNTTPPQTAVTTLSIWDPQGWATDTNVGGTTNLQGLYWPPNTQVTVTYTNGADQDQTLGTFTAGSDGSFAAPATPIDPPGLPGLPADTYNLLFTSNTTPPQTATASFAVGRINWPQGLASDTIPGGDTNVSGTWWDPNGTVIVTYNDGTGSLDQGLSLGHFAVGATGASASDTPLTIDAALTPGLHNLLFTEGSTSATVTFTIYSPQAWASDTGVGGQTRVGGSNWPPGSTVSVTYTSDAGDLSGQPVGTGTFTVGADGASGPDTPLTIDAALGVGSHDLSFTSGAQSASATFQVKAPALEVPRPVQPLLPGGQMNCSATYLPTNDSGTVTLEASDSRFTPITLGNWSSDAYGNAGCDFTIPSDVTAGPATCYLNDANGRVVSSDCEILPLPAGTALFGGSTTIGSGAVGDGVPIDPEHPEYGNHLGGVGTITPDIGYLSGSGLVFSPPSVTDWAGYYDDQGVYHSPLLNVSEWSTAAWNDDISFSKAYDRGTLSGQVTLPTNASSGYDNITVQIDGSHYQFLITFGSSQPWGSSVSMCSTIPDNLCSDAVMPSGAGTYNFAAHFNGNLVSLYVWQSGPQPADPITELYTSSVLRYALTSIDQTTVYGQATCSTYGNFGGPISLLNLYWQPGI